MAKFAPAPSISISAPSRSDMSEIAEETSSMRTGETMNSADQHSDVESIVVENSYRMEPVQCFRNHTIFNMVEELLYDELKDKRYDSKLCKDMAQSLAGTIMEKVKSLDIPRYKYVASVSIGSVREKQGLHIGSRCLWNDRTDSSATVNYNNGSLFAVVMVYGIFRE